MKDLRQARIDARCEAAAQELSGPALRVMFQIADAWKIDEDQLAGIMNLDVVEELQHWKKNIDNITLPGEKLERISYMVGIYKALHTLLPGAADNWIHRPNTERMFAGKPALNRMMSGDINDLRATRQYLDSVIAH